MKTTAKVYAAVLIAAVLCGTSVMAAGSSGEPPTELSLSSLTGTLEAGGEKQYRHPDGEKGWYYHGFEPLHDGSINGRNYAGIALEITVPAGRTFSGEVQAALPEDSMLGGKLYNPNSAEFSVAGDGSRRVFLEWSQFGRGRAVDAWVKFIKTISISGRFADGEGGSVSIKDARLVRGDVIAASCETRGKAVGAEEEATYEVTLTNCRDNPVSVSASAVLEGWEEMPIDVEPSRVTVPAGGSKQMEVRVTVTDRVSKGAFEVQTIRFVPDGDADSSEIVKLYTSRKLPGPNLMHQAEGWEKVRAKCKKYEWAAEKREEQVQRARNWDVPESRFDGGNPMAGQSREEQRNERRQPFVFTCRTAGRALSCAEAWQVSRDKELAEKVALYLRRFADPETGYLATQRACNGAEVQEGGYFRRITKAYDLIKDADVLTAKDERELRRAFRLYENVLRSHLRRGDIGNWQVSESAGGLLAALTLNNMAMADRFINGPCKLKDMISAGIMPDGWWFECSLGYSSGMARVFLQLAVALKPRGIDWINKGFPLNYSEKLSIYPATKKDPSEFAGMGYRKFGPVNRTTITLEEIYEGMLPFMDYRGVAFGMNDNQSIQVGGRNFELAYYVYRNPAFLPVLNRIKPEQRSLVYGVPDLPEPPEDKKPEYAKSFHADNIGYAVLRSQNDRPVRERIQAALKYGTHGGHHGHYDRSNLACLMRYGRNLGSPKGVWFSYVPIFYKCFNQMSTQHDMVVVDQKCQEPTESELLLFHSGDSMQAAAMETNSRWSFIPARNQGEEKLKNLWRYIPPFPNPPENPDKLTGFTERVRQRRLLVVTDDYVVMADALRGENKHTYDNSLWIHGFRELTAPQKEFLRRDPQLDSDPRKAAQLITNVDWYDTSGTVEADYSYEIEPGGHLAEYYNNEPGPMNFTVFHAWPRDSRQVAVCDLPNPGQQKRLWWHASSGDGQKLAEGYTQPWVIGTGEIDQDIEDLDELTLSTRLKYKSRRRKGNMKSLFWTGEIVTGDGEAIPLSEVPYAAENMVKSSPMEEDYYGGSIDLAGVPADEAIPAEPKDNSKPGLITLDLQGLNAKHIRATVASDHPLGEKPERRRGLIVRSTGKTARFLTVIEPYEKEGIVESVTASGPNTLEVTLADGRVHEFTITGLESSSGDIEVEMTARGDGET
ncbi:MAG: alginate lyase family protein, partial [Planctomycetota bacterium]